MRVLLLQIDGKIPNIALMRISAHHKALGDAVLFRRGHLPQLFDVKPDRTYASLIFEASRPAAERLLVQVPDAIIGGTGWSVTGTLEDHGINTKRQDYEIYPEFRQSIGFTQRGCRLRCGFCVVPRKEGAIRPEQTIAELWRGNPWPRELLLLDNDFFGQPAWRDRVAELREGRFRVSFNQGINARFLTDEAAEAIASLDYRDDSMKNKRIYTAWDNLGDEERLFDGLRRLIRYGVHPDHIMVYMLVGYRPDETPADREHRRAALRRFGARPYPMPFIRTRELVGFQRWVIGAYDKRVSWADWVTAEYEPRRLGLDSAPTLPLAVARG